MTLRFGLEVAGLTDVGHVRERNEDAIDWEAGSGLLMLADGMGGHAAGDVASRLALETLREELVPKLKGSPRVKPNKGLTRYQTLVLRAVRKANAAVHRAAHGGEVDHAGMGTTVVVAVFYSRRRERRAVVAHVGDSRVYRWRDGTLEQLTSDHSLVGEMVRQGTLEAADAARSPYNHVITRALGLEGRVQPGLRDIEVETGDLFVLCSDGLTDLVDDDTLASALAGGNGGLEARARRLVGLANEAGGTDNTSVILAEVGERSQRKSKP